VQLEPEASELEQLPLSPPVGIGTKQGLGLQVTVVAFPAVQEMLPLIVYPVLQVGKHVEPEASLLLQVPRAPFAGESTMHGFGSHVAAVKTPAKQDVGPLTVYPQAHVLRQVEPEASERVQVPMPPVVGVGIEQSLAAQEMLLRTPARQLRLLLLSVYPWLQLGTQEEP